MTWPSLPPTYASSLHQCASLQEEKNRLSNLIATINQVITYLALNLPNPQQNPGLQAACQQKINTEKRINEIVSIKRQKLLQSVVMTIYLYVHTGEGACISLMEAVVEREDQKVNHWTSDQSRKNFHKFWLASRINYVKEKGMLCEGFKVTELSFVFRDCISQNFTWQWNFLSWFWELYPWRVRTLDLSVLLHVRICRSFHMQPRNCVFTTVIHLRITFQGGVQQMGLLITGTLSWPLQVCCIRGMWKVWNWDPQT